MNRTFTIITIGTTVIGATSGAIIGLNYARRDIAVDSLCCKQNGFSPCSILLTSSAKLLTSVIIHTLKYGLIGFLWPITVPTAICQRI